MMLGQIGRRRRVFDMQEAEPCLQSLRDLASRPDASEDDIDAILHGHLCSVLDDDAHLAVVEYLTSQAEYEGIRSPTRHAFWQRVLVVALDKYRLMTSQPA